MSSPTPLARRPLLAAAVLCALALAPVFAPAPPARAFVRGGAADSIFRLIPAKPVVVEILSPKLSKEVEDIAVKMEAAARHNPRWFQSYTASHARPLPYHPNLGVTKPEYERYLDESANTPLAVTQRATLTFARDGNRNRWTLQGWGKLAPLNGTVIDLDAGTASNRRGTLALLGTAQPDDRSMPSRLDWAWFGSFRAAHLVGPKGAQQMLVASLHVGPTRDGRQVGLYWSYRRVNGGARMDDEFLLLRWNVTR